MCRCDRVTVLEPRSLGLLGLEVEVLLTGGRQRTYGSCAVSRYVRRRVELDRRDDAFAVELDALDLADVDTAIGDTGTSEQAAGLLELHRDVHRAFGQRAVEDAAIEVGDRREEDAKQPERGHKVLAVDAAPHR